MQQQQVVARWFPKKNHYSQPFSAAVYHYSQPFSAAESLKVLTTTSQK